MGVPENPTDIIFPVFFHFCRLKLDPQQLTAPFFFSFGVG